MDEDRHKVLSIVGLICGIILIIELGVAITLFILYPDVFVGV